MLAGGELAEAEYFKGNLFLRKSPLRAVLDLKLKATPEGRITKKIMPGVGRRILESSRSAETGVSFSMTHTYGFGEHRVVF